MGSGRSAPRPYLLKPYQEPVIRRFAFFAAKQAIMADKVK
jgi:hypothetical protein